jgi:hypothetical protein
MPGVRTVWLLGSDRSLDVLYEALRGEGAEVDRLGPPQVQSWLEQVDAGKTPSTLPSLLVASAALAWQDDGLLLRTLAEHQPWRFLPLVVVANADDAARWLGGHPAGRGPRTRRRADLRPLLVAHDAAARDRPRRAALTRLTDSPSRCPRGSASLPVGSPHAVQNLDSVDGRYTGFGVQVLEIKR